MARTRSKPGPKPSASDTTEPANGTTNTLPPRTSNPPKLFVLPKDASPDARIVTLDNPSTHTPSRYFYCPKKGFHEFTCIAAPRKECRSWLLTGGDKEEEKDNSSEDIGGDSRIGSGYVVQRPDLFVATPIDLLFLILPVLAPKSAKETKQHFLALDDYLDALGTEARHWRILVAQHGSLREAIERKMKAVCDTVEAGDETMFRLSNGKLLGVLAKKAQRMVVNGLPPSLEEKFVTTALEVPVMSIQRENSTLSAVTATSLKTDIVIAQDSSTPTPSIEKESQLSTTASTDSQTTADTAITTPDTADTAPQPTLTTPSEIPHLLRLRTALRYLTTTYLPPTLASTITTLLSSANSTTTLPSFAPLDDHLTALSTLRSRAATLRSISDNMTRKRGYEDDDDKVAEREEKKRKKEEEERRKKSEGRGVKQLKKVDTSGMRKMSAFFKKVDKT